MSERLGHLVSHPYNPERTPENQKALTDLIMDTPAGRLKTFTSLLEDVSQAKRLLYKVQSIYPISNHYLQSAMYSLDQVINEYQMGVDSLTVRVAKEKEMESQCLGDTNG